MFARSFGFVFACVFVYVFVGGWVDENGYALVHCMRTKQWDACLRAYMLRVLCVYAWRGHAICVCAASVLFPAMGLTHATPPHAHTHTHTSSHAHAHAHAHTHVFTHKHARPHMCAIALPYIHALSPFQAPIKTVRGRLYVRISAHIYNTMADYERLADLVLDLAKRKA